MTRGKIADSSKVKRYLKDKLYPPGVKEDRRAKWAFRNRTIKNVEYDSSK